MPRRTRKLNSFGKWLYTEAVDLGISFQDIAKCLHTSKYYLSYLMYNDDLAIETMANWKKRAEEALKKMDKDRR